MPDTERMLPCPVCKEIMILEHHGSVTIDVCAAHGIWLDQAELVRITEFDRERSGDWVWEDVFRKRVRTAVDHSRELICPASGVVMKIERYQGVHIDWSPGHGVWLDLGELEAILNNLRLDEKYMRGIALRLTETKF